MTGQRTAPDQLGLEAAQRTDRSQTAKVAHCGGACKDLMDSLCESCDSPVKGRDCSCWEKCLAMARIGDTPCATCEEVP